MLGYKPTTSTVHKIISLCTFEKELSFFKIAEVLLPRPKVANESLKKRIYFCYVFSEASKREQTLVLSP